MSRYMRLSIEILCLMVAFTAQAFDSAEWLGQRKLLGYEAARLSKAYAKCYRSVSEAAESIEIPVEAYPDGSVKLGLAAKRAQIFINTGMVWGEGVTIRQMKRGGELEAKIDADNCVVDRETRSGWVDGHAHAEFGRDVSLDGDKVYFSAYEEYLAIYTNTVLKADGKELRSVRADYDNQNGVAMFDGAVELTGAEGNVGYTINASQAFVFLSGTNELRRVVALGGVRIKSGDRSGACDRAVYTRGDSKIVMYGDGDGRKAQLADGFKRNNKIEGDRITFWIDGEQVEVVDSAVTVDAKEMKLPIGANGL